MKTNRSLRPPWFVAGVLVLTWVFAQGCSLGPRNAPVNAARARDTLRAALESWKKGDKVDALQNASPPIYVIDAEWQAGFRLKDYQIVGEGEAMDAHLLCPVKLVLSSPTGQEVKREVTYIVSTAPNLTVSRKLF